MPPSRRRTPQQERSRELVERIVAAGARVLTEHGYQGASTNRIAREAGISPGSLYQYFADKDAIVATIAGRLVADFAAEMGPVLRDTASLEPEASVPAVLDAALASLERHSGLLRALVDHVPTNEQREVLAAIRERLADRVHATLTANRDRVRSADVERTTWLVVELSQSLLVRYVLDSPPIARADFLADVTATILRLSYRDLDGD